MWRGTPAWPNYGLDGSFYYTRQDIDVQHKAIDEVWRKKMVEFVFTYNREEFLKKYRERNEMPQQLLHDTTLLKCECGRDVRDCVKPYCQTYTLLSFPRPLDKIAEV